MNWGKLLAVSALPKTTWIHDPPPQVESQRIARELEIPFCLAAILCRRGFSTPESAYSFLNPSLDQLHDPFIFKGMEKAVSRITQALCQQQKILICGDYDVDGITSVALLKKVLSSVGVDVFTHVPNRLSDGYGFHYTAVDSALESGAALLITVDCGITSREAVDYANEHHLDVIITDHHEPNGPLPNAYAIINPKCPDSQYPDPVLAGVGVAFKLAQALIQKGLLDYPLHPLLELTALGTVADVAQLTGENRVLVHYGLEAIANTSQPGLKALMKVANVPYGRRLDAIAIGYQLGPRINAVGRLGTPDHALNLLLTSSHDHATQLAGELHRFNQKRQAIEESIIKLVDQSIQQMDNETNPFIIISGEDWHEGVIGIVASKITDKHHRPCCVISVKDGVGKGSGRSISSFSLFDCLNEVQDCLLEFGGHQIAAGFRIRAEKVAEFKDRCNAIARAKLRDSDLVPKITVDSDICLDELTFTTIRQLEKLAPYGLGNPRPRFRIRSIMNRYPPRTVGSEGAHLKMVVTDGHRVIDGIAFGFGPAGVLLQSAPSFDIVATPEINNWNGREILQIQIHDFCINTQPVI